MKKPHSRADTYICIICEGPEEHEYLKRIRELDVWHERYRVDLVNADGNGNIPARYQDKYQNGQYDLVLVFCDTDKKPHEQYNDIKRKIDYFHGDVSVSDKVVIFGNPCTMQIIISHWELHLLKTPSKKVNKAIIKKYTGISGYDAHADQRKELMMQITKENYRLMRENIDKLSMRDTDESSTNFGKLMECLEGDSIDWIEEANAIIDI